MWRGGVKSFVDDLVLGRGVVISRAATSLRSVETQPLTRRFVRSQTSNISATVIISKGFCGLRVATTLSLTAEKGCEALGSLCLRTQTAVCRSNDRSLLSPHRSRSSNHPPRPAGLGGWWTLSVCSPRSRVRAPALRRVRPTGSIPVACKPSYGTVRTLLLWNKWVNGTSTHASLKHLKSTTPPGSLLGPKHVSSQNYSKSES